MIDHHCTEYVVIFKISRDWPIFVLDDSTSRIKWFKRRVPQAVFAKNSQDAVRILEQPAFRVVFLDHDLGFMDAAFPDRLHRNGKEVARYLAWTNFPGIVVIHSTNAGGAGAMKSYLPAAHVAPFGTFEVELV